MFYLFIFIALVVLFLIAKKPTRPQNKKLTPVSKEVLQGEAGEAIVQKHYCQHFSNQKTVMINNCTLRMKNGHTTQIDHVLISEYGVFVIETKNYSGLIFGDEYQKKWTVCIGKQKHQFQNPIHQNFLHVKTIQQLLQSHIDAQHIHSIVTFVGKSQFKTQLPKQVCQGEKWVEVVKEYRKAVLSVAQVQQLAKLIEKNALARTEETNCEHLESLKRRHAK